MSDFNPQPPPPRPNQWPSDQQFGVRAPGRAKITRGQWELAGFLFLALLGSLAAHSAADANFQQTGIYFVAIPGVMAILLTLLPTDAEPKSEKGPGIGAFHATFITILASALLVREGLICVIMASPLVFLIVALVKLSDEKRKNGRQLAFALPLLLVGASGEGIVYELPTNVVITETRTLDIGTEKLVSSLAAPAELPEIEPLLFALPFPEPEGFEGEGLDVGDTRVVDFGDTGQIDLIITESTESSVTWTFADDSTPLADWMTLHHATASWVETPDGVALTMAIEFDRELAPAFYFDPLERWGVSEFAEVLLDMIEHNAIDA